MLEIIELIPPPYYRFQLFHYSALVNQKVSNVFEYHFIHYICHARNCWLALLRSDYSEPVNPVLALYNTDYTKGILCMNIIKDKECHHQ